MLLTCQSSKNSAYRTARDTFYENRQSRYKKINSLSTKMTHSLQTLEKVRSLVNGNGSYQEKIEALKVLLSDITSNETIKTVQELNDINKESVYIIKNNDYYAELESKSLKLQNRVSSIVKSLEFSTDIVFFAGTIGYGCNLGIGKIAKISSEINQNELEHAVNWYFTSDNLNDANNRILRLIDRIKLSDIYSRKDNLIYTSSDGKKYNIGVESLDASYSYKYFGQGMGVSTYTFIDNRHLLFHSTVITPSEREAAYVIDGLMHNDVVKSDIHSTDTHGYSEIIFGVTDLLGISFAPRIKNFKKQSIYSFKTYAEYKKLGYKILPNGRINKEFIAKHWDDILRFIATIILKETTASQLFRRLSSYSKQHSLYKALKQFGRILKSIYLLRYIDDLELRQAIEKQLNKIENIHKFEDAVYFAQNQEFQQSTRQEQIIVEGCKRLIENCIICWNYLYLSKLIADTESYSDKKRLINIIKNGSVVIWYHVNFQGENNFSDNVLKDRVEFNLSKLLNLNISITDDFNPSKMSYAQ